MRSWTSLTVICILGVSCGGEHMPLKSNSNTAQSGAGLTVPTQINYVAHIRPLFERRCAYCHNPSSVAPNVPNWLNYEVAFQKKDRIFQRVVVERTMPMAPYSMGDDERAWIAAWVKAGAPESAEPEGPLAAGGAGAQKAKKGLVELSSAINQDLSSGRLEKTDQLLIRWAYSQVTDPEGRTALITAILDSPDETAQQIAVIKSLCERGIHLNAYYNGGTALIWAVIKNQPNVAQVLLEAKADANVDVDSSTDTRLANKREYTPLMLAVETQNPDLVKALMSHGADPARRLPNGINAMSLANQLPQSEKKTMIIQYLTTVPTSPFE